jgi:hypothetical protein
MNVTKALAVVAGILVLATYVTAAPLIPVAVIVLAIGLFFA